MADQVTEKDAQPEASPVAQRMTRFLDRMRITPQEKLLRQTESMGGKACCTDDGKPQLSPGVVWEGIFHGYAGYAKANREIVNRVSNHMYVQTVHSIGEPKWNDPIRGRLNFNDEIRLKPTCPLVRLLGPDSNRNGQRHRIAWTMMESTRTHQDMIDKMNLMFDEVWTPTQWNLDTFRRSGLTTHGRVMKLGVDPITYRPRPKKVFAPCLLLSTKNAGRKEVPQGFVFLSVSLPSFRKGFDLLSKAFEAAFGNNPSIALVIATTFFSPNVPELSGLEKLKSRIYALTGEYTEDQMAQIYSSCDAYVGSSRGEGWNLGACEAAACGLPVICPDNTAHPEVVGSDGWLFRSEGEMVYPGSEGIHEWYKGVPFARFGKRSFTDLVELLRLVERGGKKVEEKARRFRLKVTNDLNWDNAAREVSHRLIELQP